MKFTHSLALLSAALIIPSAVAHFHIVHGIFNRLKACSSNYYNCKCIRDGDRAGQVAINGHDVSSLPDDFFQVEAGFCEMGLLNFYKRSDGAWDFYVSNGDGTLQGTCFPNTATTTCSVAGPGMSHNGKIVFHDVLLCHSSICED